MRVQLLSVLLLSVLVALAVASPAASSAPRFAAVKVVAESEVDAATETEKPMVVSGHPKLSAPTGVTVVHEDGFESVPSADGTHKPRHPHNHNKRNLKGLTRPHIVPDHHIRELPEHRHHRLAHSGNLIAARIESEINSGITHHRRHRAHRRNEHVEPEYHREARREHIVPEYHPEPRHPARIERRRSQHSHALREHAKHMEKLEKLVNDIHYRHTGKRAPSFDINEERRRVREEHRRHSEEYHRKHDRHYDDYPHERPAEHKPRIHHRHAQLDNLEKQLANIQLRRDQHRHSARNVLSRSSSSHSRSHSHRRRDHHDLPSMPATNPAVDAALAKQNAIFADIQSTLKKIVASSRSTHKANQESARGLKALKLQGRRASALIERVNKLNKSMNKKQTAGVKLSKKDAKKYHKSLLQLRNLTKKVLSAVKATDANTADVKKFALNFPKKQYNLKELHRYAQHRAKTRGQLIYKRLNPSSLKKQAVKKSIKAVKLAKKLF